MNITFYFGFFFKSPFWRFYTICHLHPECMQSKTPLAQHTRVKKWIQKWILNDISEISAIISPLLLFLL